MVELFGDVRDSMAWAACHKAEEIAHSLKDEVKPFYIICAAKADPHLHGAIVNGMYSSGGIRESWRWTHQRPPKMLGILVWFVNNPLGIFELVEELSFPPDIPLDPSMLSDRSEDRCYSVMQTGKDNRVIVS
jgi:hypothetical protein